MFKPIHDLESLTDEQREQHYLEACLHFQLPYELRLLDYMWMDANDGKRNLVLYAKKGATDLIRERQDISVISTVPANGPGYVAFIVEGKNKDSRHEFAVGSCSISGLAGQNLANAVMIAHTRAVRRLTLQFVGGGLLDESEVQGPVTDINRAGGSLASLATLPAPPQPAVPPSSEPGKDVTTEQLIVTIISDGTKKDIADTWQVAPAPFSGGNIIPQFVQTVEEMSARPLVQIEPAPKRKPGRKKSEISLDSPVLVPVENVPKGEEEKIAEELGVPVSQVHKLDISPTEAEAMLKASLPKLSPNPEPAINPDTPTKEETAAWKARLAPYTTQGGILNQGGLTENVFGKLRMFTMKQFPNAVVLPNKAIMLTNTQWAALLNKFESLVAEQGPAGLVFAIEQAAR